jgi:hypothetical protein
MTYGIIRTVDIDCGDHGFTYERTIESGVKSIKMAEYYLRRICHSKKYLNALNKEFNDRHAVKIEEVWSIRGEDGAKASENYWERSIRREHEKGESGEVNKKFIQKLSNRMVDKIMSGASKKEIEEAVRDSMSEIQFERMVNNL